MTKASVELLVELAKLRFRSEAVRVRLDDARLAATDELARRGLVLLARLAARLPTELLYDVRFAATDELARRGLHVITPRARPPKVA